MKKVKQLIIAMLASLLLIVNTVPSIVYASEVTRIQQEEKVIEEKLSQPLEISKVS